MSRFIKDIPSTPHFDFVYGKYDLGNWTIPYFSTVMNLLDVANSLKLACDFPGQQLEELSIEELYQRDIDWSRVENKIVPYLKAEDIPKFFNSITVVLMPYDSGENSFANIDSTSWKPPGVDNPSRFEPNGKIKNFGPFSFGYWDAWEKYTDEGASTGQIRWNPDEVFAVAIDGQHRLAAIQKYVQDSSGAKNAIKQTSVPVIFLILEKGCGFEGSRKGSPVTILRKLFIDLNKHAQSVSRARQILLDDNDPISLCVRAFISDTLNAKSTSLTDKVSRIPLSYVDWHSEQGKFDDGPYCTTVLGLDWIIANCLNTKSISDLTDYSAIRKQIKKLQINLELPMDDALNRLKQLEEFEQAPFHFKTSQDNDELERIVNSFIELWNRPLAKLLSEFNPYKKLVELRNDISNNTVPTNAEFSNWYRLLNNKDKGNGKGKAVQEYTNFINHMEHRSDAPVSERAMNSHLEKIEDFKKDNLSFNVAFQRAYFLAFLEFKTIETGEFDEVDRLDEGFDAIDVMNIEDDDGIQDCNDDVSDNELSSNMTTAEIIIERADKFIEALNEIDNCWSGFLNIKTRYSIDNDKEEYFWLGSLKKAEGGIDFTKGASKRSADIIFLIAAMYVYDSITEPNKTSEFSGFIDAIETDEIGFLTKSRRAFVRLYRKDASVGGRILQSKDKEFSEHESREEILGRLEYLWKKMNL